MFEKRLFWEYGIGLHRRQYRRTRRSLLLQLRHHRPRRRRRKCGRIRFFAALWNLRWSCNWGLLTELRPGTMLRRGVGSISREPKRGWIPIHGKSSPLALCWNLFGCVLIIDDYWLSRLAVWKNCSMDRYLCDGRGQIFWVDSQLEHSQSFLQDTK